MILAVFGDIHANLEALDAVLADARARGAEQFLCLGDIIDYSGPADACIERVRNLGCPTVLGNHEAWALRDRGLDQTKLHPPRKQAKLSDASFDWLAGLPMTYHDQGISVVHASFSRPERWPFLTEPELVRASFQRQPTKIAFHGHTHVAGYWQEGSDRFIVPVPNTSIRLDPDRRYMINPGSVGDPKDVRSGYSNRYLIFDSVDQTLCFISGAFRDCVS